ncbi:histidine kinase [Bacillus sp. 31A1R]|uniref:histidine kinase n=1 Tax=Robertmurraya mangrovi TaxID=3098077 RepID=A0ABU5IYQ4_9BACI|nr:histidine kinase [Bacillus sp. 31A1R]MDZ5472295.1 histidine kinase [Bacillus sp. 31A1R]
MNILRLFKVIANQLNNLSLQQKLIALYITIIIIPIIIFTTIYSKDVYNRAINEIRIQNESALEIEKIHIKNNIETMRRTAQMVISDMEFIDFVKTRNEANINELIDFKMNELSNVTRLQANNPAIENIRLYTTNPYVTEMWPILFQEKRIMNKPWRGEVIRRNGMELWWFDQQTEDVLERLPSQNTSKISLLRELDYPKNEHLGIIEINMFLKNFFPKMFGTMNNHDSVYVVLDKDMNMIRNYQHTFFEDKNINPEWLKSEFVKSQKEHKVSFQFNSNGTPYLVITAYLDDLEATLLNVISLEGLNAETAKTRNVFLSGIIILVTILSLFTYVLVSLLLKKMYHLKDSMKRVEKGDFNVDVDISGHDEIAELGFHFKSMIGKINSLIADAVNKQAAAKETELKALKTQIDSHFLYNTLENIKMMAEIEGKYDISDAITSLGEMMRYNLRWKNDFVVLDEELHYIKNYIDIMNLRLDGLLNLEIDVPRELLEQEVLKMSLQPIVENAVKHGIIPKNLSSHGTITIKVDYSDGIAVIEITDNGIGMNPEQCDQLNTRIQCEQENAQYSFKDGNGIGVRNVNERIKLYYGNEYGVSVTSKEGEFTTVTIKVPSKLMKGGSHRV